MIHWLHKYIFKGTKWVLIGTVITILYLWFQQYQQYQHQAK